MKETTFRQHSFVLVFLIVSFFCARSSFASHIVGGEMTYTRVDDSTYTVILSLYGDCGPASAVLMATMPATKPLICIFDGATNYGRDSLVLDTAASGMEIPVAWGPPFVSQCTDMTSMFPGIKKYVYKKDIVLPHTSAGWRFVYNGYNTNMTTAGLAAAVTNVAPYYTMQIQAKVNTAAGNSSIIYQNTISPFFCINHPVSYFPLVTDAESDSVYYQLINAKTNPIAAGDGNCYDTSWNMNYNLAYTGIAPLATSAFSFDNHTGVMSFTPNLLQRAIVQYEADEYRAGVWVGSTQRVMTVLVVVCSGVGVDDLPGATDVKIYPDPASSIVEITLNAATYSAMTVSSMMGKLMLQQQITNGHSTLDVSNWPAGVYMLILSGNNTIRTERIVVQ